MRNQVARAIYAASKDGEKIKASIRLKKNGRFASVNGKVNSIKVSQDGVPYVVFSKTKGFQSVHLGNVISVNRNGKLYRNGG